MAAQFVPVGTKFSYYAPLGAVVATSVTVAASLRGTARAFAAILLRALVVALVDMFFEPPVPQVPTAPMAAGLEQQELPDERGWPERQSFIESRLRAVAGALAFQRPGGADAGRISHAWTVVATLTERLGEVRSAGDDGLHVTSNIVNSLRRLLQSLELSGGPTPE